jgi:hypothetical protein
MQMLFFSGEAGSGFCASEGRGDGVLHWQAAAYDFNP